jgi:hypothetical protein
MSLVVIEQSTAPKGPTINTDPVRQLQSTQETQNQKAIPMEQLMSWASSLMHSPEEKYETGTIHQGPASIASWSLSKQKESEATDADNVLDERCKENMDEGPTQEIESNQVQEDVDRSNKPVTETREVPLTMDVLSQYSKTKQGFVDPTENSVANTQAFDASISTEFSFPFDPSTSKRYFEQKQNEGPKARASSDPPGERFSSDQHVKTGPVSRSSQPRAKRRSSVTQFNLSSGRWITEASKRESDCLAGNDSVDGKPCTEQQDETGIVAEEQGVKRAFDESPQENRSKDIHFEPSAKLDLVGPQTRQTSQVQSSWWALSEPSHFSAKLQTASQESNRQEVLLSDSAGELKSSAEALPKEGNKSTPRKPDTWADHSMLYWTRNEVATTSNKPQNETEKSLSQEDEPECQAGKYTMPWTSSWLFETNQNPGTSIPWKETSPKQQKGSMQLSSLISGPSTIQDDDEDSRDEHKDCTTWLPPYSSTQKHGEEFQNTPKSKEGGSSGSQWSSLLSGPTTVTDDEETRDESCNETPTFPSAFRLAGRES